MAKGDTGNRRVSTFREQRKMITFGNNRFEDNFDDGFFNLATDLK